MLHATNDDELAVGCQRIFTSLSTRVSTKLSVVESTGRNALKKPVAPKDSKRMNKARPARLESALPTLSFKQCRVRQWLFPANRCSALSTHASVPEMWFVLDHVPVQHLPKLQQGGAIHVTLGFAQADHVDVPLGYVRFKLLLDELQMESKGQ